MNNDSLYRKDKVKYLFNVFTGNFDMALEFNENRIVTHSYNSAGNPLLGYDSRSNTEIPQEDLVVTDEVGNVVVV